MTLLASMNEAGFAAWDTGGGCKAWGKRTADDQHYVLICTDDSGLGDDDTDRWLVGIYKNETALDGDCFMVVGREQAITLASRMLRCPQFFFGHQPT